MAKKTVNIGTSVNKGDGDPLRTAFGKINDNFDEIYGAIGADGTIFNPLSVDSHLLPDTDNTRDLGSPAKRWRDIFVAPGSLYIGDIKLSNDNGTLVVQQVTDAGLVTETPVPGAPGSVTTDRLVNGAKEVVLTGGANPYVTFPTVSSGENITIQGAEITSVNGAVAITSSDSVVINTNALTALNTWTFGDDGNLELPPGFINTNQVTGLNLRSGYDVHIISNHADVDREWVLDSYGDLTIPGGIKSEGAINIDINLSDSTLRRWTFTEGGDLRFPDSTVQTTAWTGAGDIRGSVFADDSTMLVDGTGAKIVGPIETSSLRTSETKIALGSTAGVTNQGALSVAIGSQAGTTNQGQQSTAVGSGAGNLDQGLGSVAIGSNAGAFYQGTRAVAVGVLAGSQNQGEYAVALGNFAGGSNQPANSIVINATGQALNGSAAGFFVDPIRNIDGSAFLNYNASTKEIGYSNDIRSENAINIDINLSDSTLRRWTFGEDGNLTAPGDITVAGGQIFGYVENDRFAVDGDTYQVRIGAGAGATTQGADAVAIGEGSGNYQQGTRSIAIGRGSGNSDQGISAVGIGFCAGGAQQGDYAIAIGFKAGRGPMAGDPDPAQPNNSIIINASGDKLNGTNSGLYIDPVREDTGNTAKSVYYDTTTKELTYADPTGGSGDSLLSDNNDITVEIDNAGTPGNTLTWTFGTDGNLTLPRGDIVSSDDISLIINSVDSTSYRWKFNQLGFVEIPNVNNQLGGTIGDTFANGGITIAASEAAGSYVELTNGDQTAGIYVQGDSTTTGANDVQVAIYTNNSGGMEFTGDGNAQLLGDLNLNNGVIKSVKGIDERTTGSFSAGVLTINNNQRNGDVRNFNTSGGFPFPPLFTANFTVNLTGFTLQQDHFTTVRVEIEQHSSAGYYPSVLQIDGVAQTINWEGGVNPAPIGGTRDLAVFYIRNTSATIIPAYSVIGHYIGGNQTRFDGDVTGSVFADDSTLLVDGVSGVLRANVNVPNTWTVTTGDKTWSFIYGDIGEGTTPTLEFPGNLQAAGSQTALFARTGDLSSNWGMSIDAGNSPYYVDIGELSGSNYWRFSGDGSLTLPGDIHGAPVISGGAFPSQVGRTVNITPADDASDKSFKFRIDQYGETFTRAYLEFPTAEVDKQVAAVFPHANGKAGFIYTQGNDTNGQGMNDAFNIFYNNGDIKITSMGSSGGLYTWKFGDSGDLTLPGNIQSEGSINIDINLSDSTLRRWRFGEDGDLAFPDATVQTTAFTGNAATIDILNTNGIDTNYSITFVENRDGAEILRADVDLTFNSWSNTLTAGNVAIKQTLTGGTDDGSDLIITSQPNPDRNNASNIGIYPGGATGTASQSGFVLIQGGNSDVVGLAGGNVIMRGGAHTNGGVGGTIKVESVLKIDDGVHEKFQTKADATGTVTHDCSAGHIFFHTSPDANWTANFTNLNLSSGYATTVTLVIEQGGTGYYPDAVQIGGNGVGILWQGNATPTPSTNRIDVVTFSILYDGLYTVLGQLTGF